MKDKVNSAKGANVAADNSTEGAMEDFLQELDDKLLNLSTFLKDIGITLDRMEDLFDDLDLDYEEEYDLDEYDDVLAHFDNDDKIVMVFFPGKALELMEVWEAYDLLPCFLEKFDRIENFHGMYGMNFYYQKDQVITVEGEKFLIGPAVICSTDCDANLRSMTAEEIYRVSRYVEHFDGALTDGEKGFHALQLPL